MERIDKFLEQRRTDGLIRILRPAYSRGCGKTYRNGREFFDFSSNDYLGLANHPHLKQASQKAVAEFGTGSSASRLLSGDSELYHELEHTTALLKAKENALVFNSGYQANIGIISSLCKSGDAVFCDKLSHASILDGIRLSGAKMFRFAHNDANHLAMLLKKNADKFKNSLIITETIFSMDGDKAPLKEIVELKEKFGAALMVDEAHATGIFGKNGAGMVEQEGLTDRVDLIMGTFSKALGSFGGYVAGSEKIIQYLINTSRSFIYSTALPPAVIAANLAALEILEKEPFRRKELLGNSEYFRNELTKKGFEIIGCSQIVPLIIADAAKAVALSKQLEEKGFWALPIRPPTVPAGQSRLRFSLSYCHDRKVLNELIEQISELCNV